MPAHATTVIRARNFIVTAWPQARASVNSPGESFDPALAVVTDQFSATETAAILTEEAGILTDTTIAASTVMAPHEIQSAPFPAAKSFIPAAGPATIAIDHIKP